MKATNKTHSSSGSWDARHKLTVVMFFMCSLLYSLRYNLSIGIVAMVDHSVSKSVHDNGHSDITNHSGMCPSLMSAVENATILKQPINEELPPQSVLTFQWDERDQGLVLGSFFWGYVISQFPGGLIAQKYGGKWVIGLGMLWTGILSLVLPYAAVIGGRDFVIFIRILQGLGEGVVVPSIAVLLAKWTGPEERARLSAICFSGMPFGTAATMIISGHLISAFGWPAVFYVPGVLTIMWFILWIKVVHSSPEKHPSISKRELDHLNSALGDSKTHDHINMCEVPWGKIFCSLPFWAVFISQFCNAWGHNMLKAEGPKYLHSALHFDIHQNSYLSATPYLCQWIFCMLVGRASDYLIENKIVSLITARKICNTIGQWGSALAFAGIVLAECNRSLAVICFILSGMINGALLSGAIINPIDLSPNYVGAIEGVINSAANIAGFSAPYLAGLILYYQPTITGWRYVFFIPVISNVIGNFAFLFGASGKIQSWNYIHKTAPNV